MYHLPRHQWARWKRDHRPHNYIHRTHSCLLVVVAARGVHRSAWQYDGALTLIIRSYCTFLCYVFIIKAICISRVSYNVLEVVCGYSLTMYLFVFLLG